MMMRIDPLALVFRLREFVTVVYGQGMSNVFPDKQKKTKRNSILNVNLVSVWDWVVQQELRRYASDDRLFGRVAGPGWMLMNSKKHFKCGMVGEDGQRPIQPQVPEFRPISEAFSRSHAGSGLSGSICSCERKALSLRKELRVILAWCLMRIKRSEYEASNDSRSKER